jgi:hypothetical protein
MPDISDLIVHSVNHKPADFEAAFNDVIASRIASAVDAKKVEIAQQMFGADQQEIEDLEDEEDGETTE